MLKALGLVRPAHLMRIYGPMLSALAMLLGLVAPVAADTFQDAEAAYLRRDYDTALRLYRSAADEGNAKAASEIGGMYLLGKGVPQNNYEAIKWYRLAAERGDAWAQGMLGGFYLAGELLPPDHEEAAKWFLLAAMQGEAEAQYRLAQMYFDGDGVPQNFMQAYFWSSLAAGHAMFPSTTWFEAKELRNKTLRLLTPVEIAEAERKTSEFKPKTYTEKY